MNGKRITFLVLICALLLICMAGCQANPSSEEQNAAAEQDALNSSSEAAGRSSADVSQTGADTSSSQAENASQETAVAQGDAAAQEDPAAQADPSSMESSDQALPSETTAKGELMIYAHLGEKTLTIKPENNSSAQAFIELLRSQDITVDMHEYGGFEVVGPLGTSLPTNNETITTEPGDVILYQGNQITIYYDTNTWSFTRLGKVQGLSADQLREVLGASHGTSSGDGTLTVVFSLKDSLKSSAAVGEFDFENHTVLLNSGYTMPIMGLGTYALDYDTCVNSVKELLKNGGRLIDTAHMYHNEEAVGEGVRQAMEEYGIPREDIFVITKIYPDQFDDPVAAIEMALEKLDIGYVDMMLLHHPGTNDVSAYKAMETYVAQGKIHSLGLSNWYIEELTDFLPQVTIKPALVQNEIHPYYQEQDVVPFIQDQGIVVQCWYPLGGRGYTGALLGDETITSIAKAHGVSSAQVILRWDLQRGIVVIPGSSNPEHIEENLDLFSFELTEEEMAAIAALDRNEKHDWY
ncbi:MAG: aldo/keto reductase [Firmicutes bacterium]|nr:aldo/keto reductase [Bacillota bacterium]